MRNLNHNQKEDELQRLPYNCINFSRNETSCKFRHCITPFYLCHGPFSKYEEKFIMNQSILIPVPFLEDSEDVNDIIEKYYAMTHELDESHFLKNIRLNAMTQFNYV